MVEISRNGERRKVVIVDSPKVFVSFLCVALLAIVAWAYYGVEKSVSVLLLLVDMIFLARFLVIRKGCVVDPKKDEFVFPGGGIEANSLIDYFKPGFWLQGFTRRAVRLSGIRGVSAFEQRTGAEDGQTHKKNLLEINGDFGAASIDFWSRAKRNQLYSAILSANNMGSPILNQ